MKSKDGQKEKMFSVVTSHLDESNKWKNLQLIDSSIPFYLKKEEEKAVIASGSIGYMNAINSRYEYIENILIHGKQIEYYEYGIISSIRNFSNNLLDGYQFLYFPNGQLKSKLYYEKDKMEGKGLEYYDTGVLKHEINCLNGELNGPSIEYYENGQVKSITNFVSGKVTD